MTRIRTYNELCRLDSFIERFRYLKLRSQIGMETFGWDRWLNQQFYRSAEWRWVRDQVIARDYGRDLGLEGYDIFEGPHVHHMNPMTVDLLLHDAEQAVDMNQLITVSSRTHNAIHFGDESSLAAPMVVRRPGDTKLW
jgi:hypothetical protein